MNRILLLLFLFYIPNLPATENFPWNITQISNNNQYKINLNCDHPPTFNAFQSCWFTLTDKTKAIAIATPKIYIQGGMPSHQHGLPTSPKALWSDGEKRYLINGLKFSMPGMWRLSFLVEKTQNIPRDIITINFNIK